MDQQASERTSRNERGKVGRRRVFYENGCMFDNGTWIVGGFREEQIKEALERL